MSSAYCFCVTVGLSLLSLSPVLGQPSDRTETEVRYGIHGGPAVTTLGIGTTGGIAVEIDRHIFSVRGVNTNPTPGRETWEIGFLYGRGISTENIFLSAGAGTSIVGGVGYPRLFGGGEGEEFEPMIGFPLEGRVSWIPTAVIALDVYAFANVNTAQPLGGIGLTLRLGNLR